MKLRIGRARAVPITARCYCNDTGVSLGHRTAYRLRTVGQRIAGRSPPEVVRVEIGAGTAQGGKRSLNGQRFYYLDDGTELSASSVAAVTDELMLIGTVFSEDIVVCDLSDSKEQAPY